MQYIIEIIIAFIAFAGTFIGAVMASNKSQAVMQEQIKSVREDINTLSNRVDKHNHLVERMAVAENTLKSHQHQIDDIKEDMER